MSERNIPFGRPMLDEREIAAVTEVLSGPMLVHGKVTHEFEETFARRAGVAHAISVSNCTAGLHLLLFANGVGPGDEVIVPAMTHVATAHAVEFCGATPVFADVEPDTGNMDAAAVEAAVTGRTRAILPVHYLGLPCDMDALSDIARKADAFLIEDCALAIDATYGERKAGGLGLGASFSFYPVKHMTTIEGGMVTTDDDALAEQIRKRRAFGYDRVVGQRAQPGIYDVDVLGYNSRMNEVEAAVGLTQLAKLDEFQARRRENFAALRAGLSDIDGVTVFAPEKGKARSAHYCLNAVLPRDGGLERAKIVAALRERGVGTSVHYPSTIPDFTYYRDKYGDRSGQFPVAEWLAAQTISLPVGPHLQPGDADYIAAAFKDAVRDARS